MIQLNPSIQHLLEKTPQERLQEDAILIAKNSNTKLLNIKSFQSSYFRDKYTGHNNTSLEISKEMLMEKNCESSPLFFKVTANVSFCSQFGGCCIFFNCGLTKEQMRILYSVNCQTEIYTEVKKLYENSIPNFDSLFEYSFSQKNATKFKLMGLSEDTILLKIKKEMPNKRNTFIYNSALLQLQMLRCDFLITPNLTEYYFKQFFNETPSSLIAPLNEMPTQNILNELCHHQNSSRKTNTPTINNRNATEQNIHQENNYMQTDICNETPEFNDSEDDENSINSENASVYSSSDEDEDVCATTIPIHVKNSDIQPQILDKTDLINLPKHTLHKKSSSLISSITSNGQPKSIKSISSGTVSSIEFIMNSNKSETGVTEQFSQLQCKNKKTSKLQSNKNTSSAQSSSGLTENVYELNLNENISINTEDETFTNFKQSREEIDPINYAQSSSGLTENILKLNLTGKSNVDSESEIQDVCSNILTNILERYDKNPVTIENFSAFYLDNEKRKVYNVDFLELLIENNIDIPRQLIFDDYKDLHKDLNKYLHDNDYVRGNIESIKLSLTDIKCDRNNRLKQAAFLYILDNLLKFTE